MIPLEVGVIEASPMVAEGADLITVVMPVHNAMPFLDAAIASILNQTHRDFSLAIYDDASDDGSLQRALEWAARDSRIEVARGSARLGPCGSSNAAARMARTEIVARMDADDIAAPDRLTLQLDALRRNPAAVLVGSTFDMIDGEGRIIRPASPERIAGSAPPFAHPSIMYRRSAFEAAGGYRDDTDYFEDHDLFARMEQIGTLLVINMPLIGMRFAAQHARLRDDRLAVLERINRQYGKAGSAKRDLSPLAIYAVAVLAIQARQRPRLLGTMLRRAHFAEPLKTIALAAIVALAEVSPTLARGLSRLGFALRELLYRHRFRDGAIYRWQSGRPGVRAAP